MKRLAAVSVVILLALSASFAADGPRVTVRGGVFWPSDADFRTIYGAGAIWGIEVSWLFGRHIEPWISGDLVSKHGHMVPTQEKTRIWLVPAAAGLRYVAWIGRLRLHAGGGVVYHFFRESTPFGKVTDGGWSATAEAGCGVPLSKTWDLGLSLRYSHCRLKPQELSFDVGGLRAALGIGFHFK
jgi:opacity protein-like surface antigen